MIGIQRRIISYLIGSRCKEALILVNDFIVLTLELDDSFLQGLLPQNTLVFIDRVNLFSQLYLLILDFVNAVNFPE